MIADNFGENKAFNTESTLKVLYVILGIIGFMIIVGVVFDLVNYCHAKKNKDLKSDNSGLSGSNSGLSGSNSGLLGSNSGLSGSNSGLLGTNSDLSGYLSQSW